MNTPAYRVSLSFGKLNDYDLIGFATKVHTDLYGNPAYPAPPLTAADLNQAITALSDAKTAQASGGKAATAIKNTCRAELLAPLKKLAYYVQLTCDNNLATLLGSGFESTSTNRSRGPLATPSILRIVPGMTGQALVTGSPDSNAHSYEVQKAELLEDGTPGPFVTGGLQPGSRNIPVDDLTPGKLYAFQLRAIGGTTGFSNWSDALVHRAA